MIRSTVLAVVVGALAVFGGTAQAAGIKAQPWEFVGTAEQCGTAGEDTVAAQWVAQEGLPDAGKSNHALYLQKFGPTPNCAAAGASISGVEGIELTEIGFDYRNDGECGAGAPRFNVQTTDGFTFLGCSAAVASAVPGHPDWTRVRMTPPSGEVISIEIVFDEGTDAGAGFVFLDNITINGTVIGQPGQG